jgi:hypothetical protein
MEPERVDLSALDPTRDRIGYERLVHRILEAAAPELARRRAAANPLVQLAAWARPALAAAAVIAVLAAGAIAMAERYDGAQDPAGTIADALGVPAPASDWLAEGRAPTTGDLVLAVER